LSFRKNITANALPTTGTDRVLPTGDTVMDCNRAVFIRAPAILHVGEGTEVVATVRPPPLRDSASLLQILPSYGEDERQSTQERVIVAVAKFVGASEMPVFLGTAFHPELTNNLKWHRFFCAMVTAWLTNASTK
jgi:glutamine amidotransferase PdxT